MNDNAKFKEVADLIRADKIKDVIAMINTYEVDYNLCNDNKRNLLMVAVANNSVDLARFLLSKVNINDSNQKGKTPLFIAVRKNNFDSMPLWRIKI